MECALFAFAAFARFSLDSARTKIPIARMAASQKINRAALDIFILWVLFYAPAFGISLCRNAADALRFITRNLAQAAARKASRIFEQQRENLSTVAIKR
jgi:hypothetical protein